MSTTLAQLQQEFTAAIQDLWWVSETDAPWTVDVWSDLTSLAATEAKTIELDSFFAPAIQIQDGYCEAEMAEVKRYQTLLQLLQQHCTHCQVYRVGHIEIDIYVVGQINAPEIDAPWIVLNTKAVET